MENTDDFRTLISRLTLEPQPQAGIHFEMRARVGGDILTFACPEYFDGIVYAAADQKAAGLLRKARARERLDLLDHGTPGSAPSWAREPKQPP